MRVNLFQIIQADSPHPEVIQNLDETQVILPVDLLKLNLW